MPSLDDRQTPLHEAALQGKVDEVRQLLRFGSCRRARDRRGRTPAELGAAWVEVLEVLEQEPEVQPREVVVVAPPTCVVVAQGLEKVGKEVAGLGVALGKEVGESTTHLVTKEEQVGRRQHLEAVCWGVEVVGEAWVARCREEGAVVEVEEEHKLGGGGAEVARRRRRALEPRVLAGLHIYLHGGFTRSNRTIIK